MRTIDYDSRKLSRRTDSSTSHRAARSNVINKASDRWAVLLVHGQAEQRDPGRGLTHFEVGDRLLSKASAKRQDTARKRSSDLFKLGYIRDSDRERQTPSGEYAIVWLITKKGMDLLRTNGAFDRSKT